MGIKPDSAANKRKTVISVELEIIPISHLQEEKQKHYQFSSFQDPMINNYRWSTAKKKKADNFLHSNST